MTFPILYLHDDLYLNEACALVLMYQDSGQLNLTRFVPPPIRMYDYLVERNCVGTRCNSLFCQIGL